MRHVLPTVLALVIVAALATWAVEAYLSSEAIELGFHGTLATFLCLFLIPGVTIGLMRLLRLSHDRGFDERADSYVRDHTDDSPPDARSR